jgi:pimeloyl-ACP methyl ester carboxylesterase
VATVTSQDGTLIDYDRYGEDGPVVIFIAGATQYSAVDLYTPQTAELLAAAGCTGIVYDRRGRGRSGDTPPWTPAREVEDVAALIERVGGEAILYSSSSGAAIALAAAAAGVGVRALALYEPPFFAGVDQGKHLAALRELLGQGRNDEAMRYNLGSVIGLPEPALEGMASLPSWSDFVAVAPTLVYDLTYVDEINRDPDWQRRWAEVTVPAIVYSGDQTFPGMPQAADAVAAALPAAQRRILPGQGHGPLPDAIAPPLLEFLREQQLLPDVRPAG